MGHLRSQYAEEKTDAKGDAQYEGGSQINDDSINELVENDTLSKNKKKKKVKFDRQKQNASVTNVPAEFDDSSVASDNTITGVEASVSRPKTKFNISKIIKHVELPDYYDDDIINDMAKLGQNRYNIDEENAEIR